MVPHSGYKPIPGIDTHSAADLAELIAWANRPRVDRRALYAAAGEMTPTHRLTDSAGTYEGVIMDTVEGERFVGFQVGTRWAIPHDTQWIHLATPIASEGM